MLHIQSKVTFDSEVCKGVQFTVRRLSKIQRARRDMAITEHLIRWTDLATENSDIFQRHSAAILKDRDAMMPLADRQRAAAINVELGILMGQHIVPSTLKASLISITGLDFEGLGEDSSIDALMEYGSDELIEEIYRRCEELSGLTVEQQKNLQPPTTLTDQESGGGKIEDGIAGSAAA